MRRVLIAFTLALIGAAPAVAHVPNTSIGQAVQVLRTVPVSYENGAAVSDLEADAFGRLPGVGEGISVAVMPGSGLQEIAGGPPAVAAEIAREAHLHGTLVVLAGHELGAWSDEIRRVRLERLVRGAEKTPGGGATEVAALVTNIGAEPTPSDGGGFPWAILLVTVALIAGLGALLVVLSGRRRAPASRSRP